MDSIGKQAPLRINISIRFKKWTFTAKEYAGLAELGKAIEKSRGLAIDRLTDMLDHPWSFLKAPGQGQQ